MSKLVDLILADGQTTPADHTFSGSSTQFGSEPAVWFDRATDNLLGYRRITLTVSKITPQKPIKVRVVISDPVLAAVNPNCCDSQPQVAYTDFFDATFSLAYGSTTANRKDILAYAKGMLATATMASAVVGLEPVATS